MRNLGNFRQAVVSPKYWNLMGYFCLKNTFLQLKHIQRIYLTISTTCVKIHQIPCHFWNNKSFFTAQFLCIQSAHFQTFLLFPLKFTKFLMSFFKQKVSFSSKFCVMRDNTSVLFIVETLSAIDKSSPSKWKLTKFLMSFFKPPFSFHLNIVLHFSVMTHNSSVTF